MYISHINQNGLTGSIHMCPFPTNILEHFLEPGKKTLKFVNEQNCRHVFLLSMQIGCHSERHVLVQVNTTVGVCFLEKSREARKYCAHVGLASTLTSITLLPSGKDLTPSRLGEKKVSTFG